MTVLASEDKLFEISNFVIEWNKFYNIKAVFFRRKNTSPNVLFLINQYGQEVKPIQKFEHESFNLNSSNDSSFVNKMRKLFGS